MYTYSHEAWTITPYWQYSHVPTDAKIGLPSSGSTNGGAVLLNYNFKGGFSLAARPEYIASSSSLAATNPNALNLLYGPGSSAFGFTVTPTYQKGGFFLRGDVGIADARKFHGRRCFRQSGHKWHAGPRHDRVGIHVLSLPKQ